MSSRIHRCNYGHIIEHAKGDAAECQRIEDGLFSWKLECPECEKRMPDADEVRTAWLNGHEQGWNDCLFEWEQQDKLGPLGRALRSFRFARRRLSASWHRQT